jgi:hypothetical protein
LAFEIQRILKKYLEECADVGNIQQLRNSGGQAQLDQKGPVCQNLKKGQINY